MKTSFFTGNLIIINAMQHIGLTSIFMFKNYNQRLNKTWKKDKSKGAKEHSRDSKRNSKDLMYNSIPPKKLPMRI